MIAIRLAGASLFAQPSSRDQNPGQEQEQEQEQEPEQDW